MINYAKYYESNTANVSDAQGNITCNPETVTHTSNRNETVTRTSNGNFEQQLLNNWTIPVLPLLMNKGVDKGIVMIVLAQHNLLATLIDYVVADKDSGGAWIKRTPRQVSRAQFDGSTPCNIFIAVSVVDPPY